MSSTPRYNYIITVHNKEDMIQQVLMHVLMCCRENSHIYPVLDGCTDKTEMLVDEMINSITGTPITKVLTPDVHELLSINAGLRAADQSGDGFNIILQDDVLLADFMLEKKITALYEWAGSKLGYISLRLGVNFKRDAATSTEAVPLTDYIENVYGHGLAGATPLPPGYLAYRTVPVKSPVCIPFKLIRDVGMLDERLAPYGHDDPEYAIRVINAGYQNAAFSLRFHSDIKWGGTRIKPHPQLGNIVERNMNRIRDWHRNSLETICSTKQPTDVIMVPQMSSEKEIHEALDIWKQNVKKLESYRTERRSILSKITSIIKQPFTRV